MSLCACGAGCTDGVCTAEELGEYYDEGPTCHSCDGLISENAITCPCGVVIDEDRFWVDPMRDATFEERVQFEHALEMEERGW